MPIIKAKGEIANTLISGPDSDMSCFGIVVPEFSKGLSVSL